MPEFIVGRRTTRYETAVVVADSREQAVAEAARGGFGDGHEEVQYDVFEATAAEVVELDGRRRLSPRPASPRSNM